MERGVERQTRCAVGARVRVAWKLEVRGCPVGAGFSRVWTSEVQVYTIYPRVLRYQRSRKTTGYGSAFRSQSTIRDPCPRGSAMAPVTLPCTILAPRPCRSPLSSERTRSAIPLYQPHFFESEEE